MTGSWMPAAATGFERAAGEKRGLSPLFSALEESLLAQLHMSAREGSDVSLAAAVTQPAINIVGLKSADTGAALHARAVRRNVFRRSRVFLHERAA